MDYTLRELECFTAVAEELSFTRAARRLHLAQPPLSRHIRSLEDKIGTRLFDREARMVKITPAGRLFHEESRGILAQLARAGEMARRSAHGEQARLRLGFVSAVLGSEIVRVLREFRDRHPTVQIMLHDVPPAEQMRMIREGKLDAGFVGLQPTDSPEGIRFVPWRRERLMVFVPKGHFLTERTRVDLSSLRGEPFVAITNDAAPAFSRKVHELCRKAGFRPRIILESSRAQAVAVMVAAGSGIAILPESLGAFVGPSAAAIRISGSPEITHVFAVGSGPSSDAMKHFLKLLPEPGRRGY